MQKFFVTNLHYSFYTDFFLFLTLTYARVYPHMKLALVISVVPSNRERTQTDKAVGVVCQVDWIPIQSHLVHVGPDVVTGVAFAEGLICY